MCSIRENVPESVPDSRSVASTAFILLSSLQCALSSVKTLFHVGLGELYARIMISCPEQISANDEVTSEPARLENLGKKFALRHDIHVYNLSIQKHRPIMIS